MRRRITIKKRVSRRTPGGRKSWVIRREKVGYARCGVCGSKLNRARLNATQLKKLPKTMKRPERPYPELCSRCMRIKIKQMLKR